MRPMMPVVVGLVVWAVCRTIYGWEREVSFWLTFWSVLLGFLAAVAIRRTWPGRFR